MATNTSTPVAPRKRRSAAKAGPDVRPVMALADTIVYPESMSPLVLEREVSPRLLEYAGDDADSSTVVLAAIRPGTIDTHDDAVDLDTVDADTLYDVGTEVAVVRRIVLPDGTVRALVQGIRRVKLLRRVSGAPVATYEVSELPDVGDPASDEVRALATQLLTTFAQAVDLSPMLPSELPAIAANLDDPGELCNFIAATARIDVADQQAVLEATDIHARQRITLRLLARELELLELGARIHGEVHTELTKTQRDFFLRRQLEQIQEELGEDGSPGTTELRERLTSIELPDVARKQVDRELARLARTPEQSPEHGVVRGYLEWIADLPWNTTTTSDIDLTSAAAILDGDHFGLDDVKDRILDHIAVTRLLKGSSAGAILCFVGPPGVGKTSLGKSIAASLGRSFARISVGGVRDENEIRGHRRTYVGAMPGVVIRALRDAGTRNPVFMIDEIDKLGSDWRGDPSSAMLEVLDPEQNNAFRDHYLDLPFDLSDALFVCTANRLDTIPPALRDRMEIVVIEGYTDDEKVEIARRHLIPRQLAENGLKKRQVTIPVRTLRAIVAEYTREAGVRELDRAIGRLARAAARRIVEAADRGEKQPRVTFAPVELRELLGPPRALHEVARRTTRPGVATGLAVMGSGGDILFVEAAATNGSGRLAVTGQVGKVMEESARAALTWIRSLADEESDDYFATHDFHVHVPAGAIPKDGPSAGIAIVTALGSLWLDRAVRSDVAMTGEVTITGDVLPIGGVKQKSLAAARAGIRDVILPERNEDDVDDLSDDVAREVTFHLVDRAEQVLDLALEP